MIVPPDRDVARLTHDADDAVTIAPVIASVFSPLC
jgi:hypothetical protein